MTRYTILAMALTLGAALAGCAKSEPAQRPQGPAIELGAGIAAPATAPQQADNAATTAPHWGANTAATTPHPANNAATAPQQADNAATTAPQQADNTATTTRHPANNTPTTALHPANNAAATASLTLSLTRGAVNDGDFFTAAVAGWETSGTPDYASPGAWLSTFTAAAGAAQPVTLTPTRYYSGYAEIKTFMKAWSPAGTLGADGRVSFAGTPDGLTDVMLAGEIAGSSEVRPADFVFNHCLTQVRFRIAAAQPSVAPVTLTSITVREAQLPTGIDLTTDAVTYAVAADFRVPEIAEGALAFTPQGANAGAPLLIRPFGRNYLTVDIVTSLGHHAGVRATIDTDERFIPGKAYTITLTYTGDNAQPLGVTVSVAPWQDVEGSGSDIPV